METKTNLKSVEKKLKKEKYVPVHDDPKDELRHLVRTHNALTKAAVRMGNMSRDRTIKETGEVIKCLLPEDDKADLQAAAARRMKTASKLESRMLRNLKQIPIYTEFLANVFGCGPVVAAYLVVMIDIHKAAKPSQLKRYCGLAVIDGRLERRSGGPKTGPTGKEDATGTYNSVLRTRLWQMFGSVRRNGSLHSCTTKYLTRWTESKERMIVGGAQRGHADNAGWHKAAELFIYDLYIVWRALEGLPSWITWYDWARGYEHGRGPVARENTPRLLSVAEALELVGHVGRMPLPASEAVAAE